MDNIYKGHSISVDFDGFDGDDVRFKYTVRNLGIFPTFDEAADAIDRAVPSGIATPEEQEAVRRAVKEWCKD